MTVRHVGGLPGQLLAGVAGVAFFVLLLLTGFIVARSVDEFQRALLLRSFLWACGGTMFVASAWGFVEAFASAPTPHLPLLAVPALLVVFTAAAKLIVFRKHRTEAEGMLA